MSDSTFVFTCGHTERHEDPWADGTPVDMERPCGACLRLARQKVRLQRLQRRLVVIGHRLEAEVRGTGYGLYVARATVNGEEVMGGGTTEGAALYRLRVNAGLI